MKTPNATRRRPAAIAAAIVTVVVAALLSTAADPSPSPAQADNPIVQTIYTADPAPLVHNGRVYLYTGHDEDGSTWFTMKEWRVWSSDDMVNWTDHGSPLNLDTFSWARQDAWAGQAVERGGKFYWYVPVINDATGRPAIGVAVADSPTGPFRDALGRPLVQNGEIDPTVFIDTDGQAYLYWGNPNLWYVKLNADMISYSGSPTQIPLTTQGFGTRPGSTDRPTLYEEGPWVYKRGSLYYNVFAAQCCSEHIAYSTAPGPTGPWTYRGTVMPTQGSSFTNHPGVIDFKGNSYFFYHNGALPGGGGFTRSVAVEKFTYNADGTIPLMNMTTAGAPQAGALNPYVRQEAETIAWGTGVETERFQRGRHERGLDRERRLDQGQGCRLRHGRDVFQRTSRLGEQRRQHRGSARRRQRAAGRHVHASRAPADGRAGQRLLPGERRLGHTRPVPEVHRWQRLPVQCELVAVHHLMADNGTGLPCGRPVLSCSTLRVHRFQGQLTDHFWLAAPLQVDRTTAVPLAVPPPEVSRHRPDWTPVTVPSALTFQLLVGPAVAVPDDRLRAGGGAVASRRPGTCRRKRSAAWTS